MNYLNAVILGLVEGITEFLPISSTAHLIIASKYLNIAQSDFQKFFEVFIQSGAILAVVLLYFSYILKNKKMLGHIVISFIPTAIIGLLLYKVIKKVFFESNLLIIWAMIVIGLVFILVEYVIKKKKLKLTQPLINITLRQAFIIGLAQSLAVIPGVSRSGIVMVSMMLMGYKRDESAVYSFLLAVPTILAASALDIITMRSVIFSSSTQNNLVFLGVGFIFSFITAYVVMKWLISFLQKKSLALFGIYRVIFGTLLLIFK